MNKTEKSKRGLLFVVSAPTGGGKTTLVTRALGSLSSRFPISRLITYTTRQPRPGEVHGTDYVFISKEEFLKLQIDNFFAETTSYNGNMYGSPLSFLQFLPTGQSFIAITDRAGIAAYQLVCPTAVCIWIYPPSLEILSLRLKNRGSESSTSLEQRIALAAQEISAEQDSPLCTYHILNEKVEEAAAQLIEIIEGHLETIF